MSLFSALSNSFFISYLNTFVQIFVHLVFFYCKYLKKADISLTYFTSMFHFHTSWKTCFLAFLAGIISNGTLTWNGLINLTLSWRRPLPYRNQSIDLRSKSVNWFLYDNGLRHERVKWSDNKWYYWNWSVVKINLIKMTTL